MQYANSGATATEARVKNTIRFLFGTGVRIVHVFIRCHLGSSSARVRALLMSIFRTILFLFAVAEPWEDTPALSAMWESMNGKKDTEVETLLVQMPEIINMRAADGRGPTWWAWEFEYSRGLAALMAAGANVET